MKFNIVVCGGTFDHFHKGHKNFLKHVFAIGKKVIIGITSDKYVANSKFKIQNSKLIESFRKRKEAVLDFIKSGEAQEKVEIVEINDLFGPTLSKGLSIDAIVVSQNTKKGAEIISRKRKELGLTPLNIVIAPLGKAEDGESISSSRIRKGEINREGKLYIKKEWFKKDFQLTQDLRKEFKKPFGELLKDVNSLFKNINNLVITVGDVTTKTFNEKSLGQNISVIDFKVARENKFTNIKELGFTGDEIIFNVDNPAGYTTSALFRKLDEIFKSEIKETTILQIDGEEDLAVLPLVLFSPLNTIIYYGQPGRGLVKVVVSEKTKEKAYNLILKLKSA